MEAVKNNGESIRFAQKHLLNDENIIIEALKSNGNAIKYVNRVILFIKIKQVYIFINFKEIIDFSMAFEAVHQSPMSIKYLPEDFKKDKDIAMEAIRGKVQAIEFVGKELYQDQDIIEEVAKADGEFALYYASEEIRANEKIVKLCVK